MFGGVGDLSAIVFGQARTEVIREAGVKAFPALLDVDQEVNIVKGRANLPASRCALRRGEPVRLRPAGYSATSPLAWLP